MWCGVTATPQWRRPRGTNKLLCNACGIFFTRYGKLPERSHHIHAVSNRASVAAVSVTLPAQPGMSASVAAVPEPYPLQSQGDADQAEPTSRIDGTDAGGESLREEVQVESQQKAVQPETLSRRRGGISFQTRFSSHKRKGAPQLESELVPDLDRSTTLVDMDTKASPAPSPEPPVAAAGAALPLRAMLAMGALSGQVRLSRLISQSAAPASGASGSVGLGTTTPVGSAIMERPTSTLLKVAPLALGLQNINQIQHLGLLGPSLMGSGALSSLYLQGLASAASTTPGSSTLDTARGLGRPGLIQSHEFGHAAATPALPPELLLGPFSLPVGSLTNREPLPNAASTVPPQRASYARPSKRQERPPAGESDDSNVSTESHAAMNGDPGTSHDEDEGGTATARPNISNMTTAATTSGTASSVPVGTLGGLSCSPPALPAEAHSLSAILARPATAVPSTLAAAAAGRVNTGSDGAPLSLPPLASGPTAPQLVPAGAGPDPSSVAQLLLQQPQVVLLEARKSKGPRGRAASATPSSSTQS
ncbi:hypothetical protein Vretimale_4165 [Volvox reticuliferus]|nr:hypothetical protein Vretifemale_2751 [Volvox reticuliferus]GIL98864.1 hypothetical protein Vretimale_4165 [Volvox reticuliferus]